ncbi:hypothetical protein BGZ80_002025 [Entomortierella chlamydospora]|uniref:MARVEL domain-containing protein n=1 Tax=Entomortierella chlamydospora TaxID=101097 RepID=A0A9P6N2R8_9FUNG|nr:hypothetical protein BGZ79_000354 [Entomortierella chlamydospora]KAG0021618.1 hypothetical protein BGZ80_002025 [Entomortierella chlamydospora]
METIGLRRFRIGIVIISLLTVVLMAAYYGSYTASNTDPNLDWRDWDNIILSIIIFFSYIYAVKGKPYLNKFIRAFLVLAASALFLYVNVGYLIDAINGSSGHNGQSGFRCETGNTTCYIFWAYTFMCIITSVLLIVDLFWTLRLGPLKPKSSQYGRYGYGEQANVTTVSPYQPQQGAYYQMQPLDANSDQRI